MILSIIAGLFCLGEEDQWFKGIGFILIGLSCIGLLVGLPTAGEGAGLPFYW
ncbi:hypothetical protein ACPA2L_28445 [Bacillus bombysepticus]